jgi:hypothetical protein
MPTYTCLCCGHAETSRRWKTPPRLARMWHRASRCSRCVISVRCAGPDPRTRRSQIAARRRARQLGKTRTTPTPRAHRGGTNSGPELRTVIGKTAPLRTLNPRPLSRETLPTSKPHSTAQHTQLLRAPDPTADTDMWGVSDPAVRPGAASAWGGGGRPRPFLTATPVLGRLAGGTNRRPSWLRPAGVNIGPFNGLRRPGDCCRAAVSRQSGNRRPARWGANRALALRPLPRPL